MSKKKGKDKLNPILDEAMAEMLKLVKSGKDVTLKDKLDIVRAAMQYEALKLKATEGAGFGDEFNEGGDDDDNFDATS